MDRSFTRFVSWPYKIIIVLIAIILGDIIAFKFFDFRNFIFRAGMRAILVGVLIYVLFYLLYFLRNMTKWR